MSAHIRPEFVVSPKARWRLHRVIFDGGPLGSPRGGWSSSEGQWEDEDGVWSAALAIRWNGTNEKPLGNPHSRGQPTWFIVPAQLEGPIRNAIDALTANNGSSAKTEE